VHEARVDPPMRVFAVTIDLRQRDVDVEVAPSGDDPDGPDGKWQTTLDETPDVAQRRGHEIAVNGDFFGVEEVIDPATGKKRGYHEGQKATVVGPAMTDGRLWSSGPAGKPRPCLVVTRERRALIDDDGKQLPPAARQVTAGSNLLVKRGKKVVETQSKFSTTRHPRTAVGIADNGRTLILVVVDGRQPKKSVGMSLDELAELMLKLGCDDALNLDGGGSSTLVLRDPQTNELVTMNTPSDGKPRPVANVLGVDLDGARAATTQPGQR
jgi:exopolysaccharide biosynthesis protein